jgi:hypothetical protein
MEAGGFKGYVLLLTVSIHFNTVPGVTTSIPNSLAAGMKPHIIHDKTPCMTVHGSRAQHPSLAA